MPLLPIADVLLIERRLCRCGAVSETHSPFRYRLFKACAGEPDKTEIRKLKDFPEKADEKADLIPLPDRVISYHETHTSWCAACFVPNMPLSEALTRRPPAPQFHPTTMQVAWTRAQSEATGKSKPKPMKPRLTLADL